MLHKITMALVAGVVLAGGPTAGAAPLGGGHGGGSFGGGHMGGGLGGAHFGGGFGGTHFGGIPGGTHFGGTLGSPHFAGTYPGRQALGPAVVSPNIAQTRNHFDHDRGLGRHRHPRFGGSFGYWPDWGYSYNDDCSNSYPYYRYRYPYDSYGCYAY